MQTSTTITFSPQFFLGIWLYPENYSEIAKKLNILYLNISQTGVGVVLTNITNEVYKIKGTSPISLNQWLFIGISLRYTYGVKSNPNYTNIDIYANGENKLLQQLRKFLLTRKIIWLSGLELLLTSRDGCTKLFTQRITGPKLILTQRLAYVLDVFVLEILTTV